MAEITNIEDLLGRNIYIPSYQRPYKWTHKNLADLLGDIDNALVDAIKYKDFKYRIGTIILHKYADGECEKFDVVDGQQRIISLVLLKHYLDPSFECNLLKVDFKNKISQANIKNNFLFLRDWFTLKDQNYKSSIKAAMKNVLEVVVISVDKVSEAFQLFDSQNTRGKALDPHDLLKANHLREMKKYPYEMQHAVKKWEAVTTKEIRELFDLYLFPIWNWSKCIKSKSFTAKEIDIYKGITEDSPYTYAKRAGKSTPYFQITEPFIAGNDFFEMVEHYIELLGDIRAEISTNKAFSRLNDIINNKSYNSAGFRYAKNLFFCSLMCYYDKFRNFDEQAVKKLFTWSLMLRVDMENLGFDSINKYAIGEDIDRYSNSVAMFSKITNSRLHNEIANIQIVVLRTQDKASSGKWNSLYNELKDLNGLGGNAR